MTATDAANGRGRRAKTPGDIPRAGWMDVGGRLWTRIMEDRAMLVAGGVSFYLIIALFPAMAAFVSLFGLFADPTAITGQMTFLEDVLPEEGLALVTDQLAALAAQESSSLGLGLAISLGVALWTANNGVKAIFEALNIAYSEREDRTIVKLHLISFAFTLGGIVLSWVLLAAVGFVPALLAFVDLGATGESVVRVLRWALVLPIVGLIITLLYRYGPSREPARWRWLSLGSGLATIVWLVASAGYSWYLENFANYDVMYGSLGALVGLLLWIWLSALILIVGAQLNAELEHQTSMDTTRLPEKPMGERGAYVADTVAE